MTVTQRTVDLVLARDGNRCARCGNHVHGERGYGWSIHHRRPRGSGGTSLGWVNTPGNLLTLCGSGTTGCHGWCETHRETARHHGFLVPRNAYYTAAQVPVLHAVYGWVLLDDAGGLTQLADGVAAETMAVYGLNRQEEQ
jgi:hypothetical protein